MLSVRLEDKVNLLYNPLAQIYRRAQVNISGCSAVGSARALGARCRRFESCHSDQIRPIIWIREVSEWSVLFVNIEFSPNYVIIS